VREVINNIVNDNNTVKDKDLLFQQRQRQKLRRYVSEFQVAPSQHL